MLQKFTSEEINLTPNDTTGPKGEFLAGLSNLGMGYVFEELIRKFNEENNEEAGEHFTPREVIELMTNIIFEPLGEDVPPVITIYDPACGSGGMLTESQNFIKTMAGEVQTHLYGKEINGETYAICKSDMMIKGEDPRNIRMGSTLASNEFYGMRFDFMLSNPPYGKSWKVDERHIKEHRKVIDPRFIIELRDYWGDIEEVEAAPRVSDGQLLFMMEMVSKMKNPRENGIGARIASVHNGSSLFTGDAGSGESNIRRYIIENDWLECIVQLPNNLFYNTGITTYIWFLNNNKPDERKGEVLLIDASQRFRKLRKNLGNKNCELSKDHIDEIVSAFMNFEDVEREGEDGLAVKRFRNKEFGYYSVVIDRPQRFSVGFSEERLEAIRGDEEVYELAKKIMESMGQEESRDYNRFVEDFDKAVKEMELRLRAPQKNKILTAIRWYDEDAEKVIKRRRKLTSKSLQTLLNRLGCKEEDLGNYGLYYDGTHYIEYEAYSDLRDTEVVPLEEAVHDYFLREVRPYVEEAWIDLERTKIGYEISFNKYFYEHKPLRTLGEVGQELLDLEKESEGLIREILSFDL